VGATGSIGRATAHALRNAGHDVTCLVRQRSANAPLSDAGIAVRVADVTNAEDLRRALRALPAFDTLVSCLASRTGAPRDAWAIDHDAHQRLLAAAREAQIPQMVLLSAICVQKPQLAFQQAKLAFEQSLMASGLTWSIVRPTAFFKSLSGQLARVRAGKPFLLFGDGTLTSCKPISDGDLATYLTRCLDEPALQQRVLPIGGPGPALTPREQGELLGAALDTRIHFRSVPVRMLDAIIAALSIGGRVIPPLAEKANLARIGRYYATESMLVWDPVLQRYDADATPSTGTETLGDHYRRLARGDAADDRGAHAVF
jgi:divinyl chlorophyllide a 8-vinyl-reductase